MCSVFLEKNTKVQKTRVNLIWGYNPSFPGLKADVRLSYTEEPVS